ncbi:MAG: epoxyqueuosine reductase QueH, partial [bacterium]
FTLRLQKTAQEAKRLGIDLYATTLSVSPHKNAKLLNELGLELGRNEGVAWLYSDFKKKDGYLRSIRLSQAYGLYRQCYCGCKFSREAQ